MSIQSNKKESSAKATVKFAIFNAIVSQWHKKDDINFAEILRDSVLEELFAPHITWSVEEYLKQCLTV